MRSKWLSQVSIAIMGLVVGAVVTGAQEAKRGEISEMQAVKELSWPLPDSAEAYASFDGQHLKSYVEELAAISRRYRDAGNRWWGRLVGMQSGVETQQWVEAKFRQARLGGDRRRVRSASPNGAAIVGRPCHGRRQDPRSDQRLPGFDWPCALLGRRDGAGHGVGRPGNALELRRQGRHWKGRLHL